jgi:hypothetical protein
MMTIYTVCVCDSDGRQTMRQEFYGRKSADAAAAHAAWLQRLLDLEAAAAARMAECESRLESAGLGCLIATSWNTPAYGSCSCDCVAMLHRVCLEGATTLDDALAALSAGRAPAGAQALQDADGMLERLRAAAERDRLVAWIELRAAYETAGLDAAEEVPGIDSMTAQQLRDQITYLSDFQG